MRNIKFVYVKLLTIFTLLSSFNNYAICDNLKLESYWISKSFIGDNEEYNIYYFIKDKLIKQSSFNDQMINKFIQNQSNIIKHRTFNKLHLAQVYEGEFASILKALCRSFKECESITLYQKNGIVIADTGFMGRFSYSDINEDIDYQIGFVGKNPDKKFGIKKIYSQRQESYYEILKAIYLNSNSTQAYQALDPINSDHLLIGYVKYIIRTSEL